MTVEELNRLLSDAKQHLAYASADCAECNCPGCAFGHGAAVDVEAAIDALTAENERLQGEHVIELATGQQQLDDLANQLSALRAASTALRDDLLSRAEWDKDAGKVVCAGNGVWLKFNEALREGQP